MNRDYLNCDYIMEIPCDAIHLFRIFSENNIKENIKMTGIYYIKNKVNEKGYVGQSIDIDRRYKEHLRAGQPNKYLQKSERDSNTPIHLAMQKYGVENFELILLEECLKEELNAKEKEWIKKLQTNTKEKGYNVSEGGQDSFGLKGENHSQAKLTEEQVKEIKNLLKNTSLSLEEIRLRFPIIKSKSMISLINTGKNWFDEKDEYPLRKTFKNNSLGSSNPRAKFTEEQVMEIRKLYSENVPTKDIIAKYNHIATDNAIKAILYNRSYKHLPNWNKKLNKWIEPCIDYSQS